LEETVIKLGCFSFMYDRETSTRIVDPLTFMRFAHELRLDTVDFALNKGFPAQDRDYLMRVRLEALRRGLTVGFVEGGGSFVGTDEELKQRVELAKQSVDTAVFMGAPMILLGTGGVPESIRPAMIGCYQEVCDYALEKGIMVGMRGHAPVTEPTGDDIIRTHKEVNRENFTFSMDTGRWVGSPGVTPKGQWDRSIDFYAFMEQTVHLASYVRAKVFKIDQGWEEWFDYERIVKILRSVDFNGTMSIYYLGKNYSACNDYEGIGLAVKHLRGILAEN
jgi:sugar phosphate isomerase/epimerase